MRQRSHEPAYRRAARAILLAPMWVFALSASLAVPPADSVLASAVDLQVLVGPRPIWAGHCFRYTVYDSAIVEARFSSMGGEVVQVLRLGMLPPGQYTLPWDGTLEGGTIFYEGRYQLELFFGEEYAAKIWFISRRIATPPE